MDIDESGRQLSSFPSLEVFASAIPDRFRALMTGVPVIRSAAEAVHQSLFALLCSVELDRDDIPKGTAALMAQGAHSAWSDALIFTASGHIDTGLGAIRRAIEFACYAPKVIGSEERARDWMSQLRDGDARRRFALTCSIPGCYGKKQYRHVWGLIVAYDMASNAGVHANLASMLGKWQGVQDGKLTYGFQADAETTVQRTAHTTFLGYRLFQAFAVTLRPCIADPTSLDQVTPYLDEQIRNLRLQLAQQAYRGSIPANIAQAIIEDDRSAIENRFKEILDESRLRSARAK